MDHIQHPFIWDNGRIIDISSSGINLTLVNSKGYYFIFKDNNGTYYEWKDNRIVELNLKFQGYSNMINEKMQVVGAGASSHGFIWDNGKYTDLGTLGGTYSWATKINDNGYIIGQSTTELGYDYHGFIWHDGTMTDLGTLGGYGASNDSSPLGAYSSEVTGINNSEQVIGNSLLVGGKTQHGFIWQDGTMTDLGTLGGDFTDVRGILYPNSLLA